MCPTADACQLIRCIRLRLFYPSKSLHIPYFIEEGNVTAAFKKQTSLSKVLDNVMRPVLESMLHCDWPTVSRLYVIGSPSSSRATSDSFLTIVPVNELQIGLISPIAGSNGKREKAMTIH